MMLLDLQAKPIHNPRVASRMMSGEAVVIDTTQNIVRMLNPVGSRIWELADGTRTLGDITAVLTTEFDVEPYRARQSVETFINELVEKDVLVWA